MKQKRFSVEQIVGILKQAEVGAPVGELIRKVGISEQTFREECLNVHWFRTLGEARQIIEAWRREYNESRPHRALGRGRRTSSPFRLQLAAIGKAWKQPKTHSDSGTKIQGPSVV